MLLQHKSCIMGSAALYQLEVTQDAPNLTHNYIVQVHWKINNYRSLLS